MSVQITGNVGLYFAGFRLSQLGWNVMPTARNARGVDLIAYQGVGERYIGVQVKTLSRRAPVPLGQTLERIAGDFWLIVVNAAKEAPNCFVLVPEEVRQGAHRGEKEGRISYWLQPGAYDLPAFRERWDRIGLAADEQAA